MPTYINTHLLVCITTPMKRFAIEDFNFTLAPSGELNMTLTRLLQPGDVGTINTGFEMARMLAQQQHYAPPPVQNYPPLMSLLSAVASPNMGLKRKKTGLSETVVSINSSVYELQHLQLRVWDVRTNKKEYPEHFCFAYTGCSIDRDLLSRTVFDGDEGWASAEGTTRGDMHFVRASLRSKTRVTYVGRVIHEYNKYVADPRKSVTPCFVFEHECNLAILPASTTANTQVLMTVEAVRFIEEDKAAGSAAYWSWKK